MLLARCAVLTVVLMKIHILGHDVLSVGVCLKEGSALIFWLL